MRDDPEWSVQPLSQVVVPPDVPLPSEPAWRAANSVTRATLMQMFMSQFPENCHAHLQQGMFYMLQSAQALSEKYGDNADAWERWVEGCKVDMEIYTDEIKEGGKPFDTEMEEGSLGDVQ